MRILYRGLALLLAAVLVCPPADAYSLQSHEQLIDLTWKSSIAPLLLSRYPNLTPAELERARAYAYAGSVIQDIGYYPFGDPFFSDLTHYVRTGDFVVHLFRDAQNANQLAFAVGALSHYIGDNIGHSQATNRAVPVEFPKLATKYGPVVTFGENAHAHVQTEFAFDINELAHQRFAPLPYLRHVGLSVPTKQLANAFYETYGLSEGFAKARTRRINVRGFRFAVRSLLPRVAYAVTLLHNKHMPADIPGPELENWSRQSRRSRRKMIGTSIEEGPASGPIRLPVSSTSFPKSARSKWWRSKGRMPTRKSSTCAASTCPSQP